jgi:hypothetical protein
VNASQGAEGGRVGPNMRGAEGSQSLRAEGGHDACAPDDVHDACRTSGDQGQTTAHEDSARRAKGAEARMGMHEVLPMLPLMLLQAPLGVAGGELRQAELEQLLLLQLAAEAGE